MAVLTLIIYTYILIKQCVQISIWEWSSGFQLTPIPVIVAEEDEEDAYCQLKFSLFFLSRYRRWWTWVQYWWARIISILADLRKVLTTFLREVNNLLFQEGKCHEPMGCDPVSVGFPVHCCYLTPTQRLTTNQLSEETMKPEATSGRPI